MKSLQRREAWLTAALVLPALAYFLWNMAAFVPYCRDPFVIVDDHRMHLLPFYAALSPDNFRESFLVDYSRAYLPPGYFVLFRLVSMVLDPLVFSKWLGLFLMGTAAFFAFLTGRRVAGAFGGVTAFVFTFQARLIQEATFPGLFRSFGYPLALAFLYCWVAGRKRTAMVLLPLTVLFYPPVFLILALAYLSEFVGPPRLLLGGKRREFLHFLVAMTVSGGILATFAAKPAEYGSVVKLEQAERMEEWDKREGRFKVLPFAPAREVAMTALASGLHPNKYGARLYKPLIEMNNGQGNPFFTWFLWLTIPAALLAAARFRWLIALPLAGVALYGMSRVLAFSFGWPDRFLNYSLPLMVIFLLPCAWYGAGKMRRFPRVAIRTLYAGLFALYFLVYPAGGDGARGYTMSVGRQAPLLQYLRSLEGPVLLAAWPGEVLDNVPIFAGKEVFIDYEHAQPLYLGFYEKVAERIEDDLRLIFTTDLAVARDIRDRYGLTHLVIEPWLMSPEGRAPGICAPFNFMASKMRRSVPKESFIFYSPPPEWIVYEDRRFQVVDLTRLPDST